MKSVRLNCEINYSLARMPKTIKESKNKHGTRTSIHPYTCISTADPRNVHYPKKAYGSLRDNSLALCVSCRRDHLRCLCLPVVGRQLRGRAAVVVDGAPVDAFVLEQQRQHAQ
eukprot:4263693-Pleurochrysis_carterae.AAC.1